MTRGWRLQMSNGYRWQDEFSLAKCKRILKPLGKLLSPTFIASARRWVQCRLLAMNRISDCVNPSRSIMRVERSSLPQISYPLRDGEYMTESRTSYHWLDTRETISLKEIGAPPGSRIGAHDALHNTISGRKQTSAMSTRELNQAFRFLVVWYPKLGERSWWGIIGCCWCPV
jgi:hypothetical protein